MSIYGGIFGFNEIVIHQIFLADAEAQIFYPTCATCTVGSYASLSFFGLFVCPDPRGVVGFLVRPNTHLLANLRKIQVLFKMCAQ